MKPKRLILGLIPNNLCNLQCEYCYISQAKIYKDDNHNFNYSVSHIANCLSKKRLGGECLINLTGQGETMLQKDIVDLTKLLLEEGHYIEFVTNLTVTKVVDQFLELPVDLQKRLEFKISFHYKELVKKGLMEKFFDNVVKIKESSFSFTLELLPTDDLIPEIDNIINICNDKVGAKPHLTVGRTDYLVNRGLLTDLKKEEYVECWSKFDSAMFNLKMKLLDKKRNEFCYAGDWTLFVNMYTGEASPCYLQPYKQNIFENPNKPINFIAVGKHCLEPYCINGHAHLAMGAIPELDLPTYDEIRNRETYDGTEWLSEETKSFFSHKLSESNNKYSLSKQYINYWGWYWRAFIFVIKHSDKVKRHIKSVMWKKKNKK